MEQASCLRCLGVSGDGSVLLLVEGAPGADKVAGEGFCSGVLVAHPDKASVEARAMTAVAVPKPNRQRPPALPRTRRP